MNLGAFAARSVSTTPFPHFIVHDALGAERSSTFLRWLETDAPWRLKIATFYQQYEFSLCDTVLPSAIRSFFSPSSVEALKLCIADSFRTTLASFRVSAFAFTTTTLLAKNRTGCWSNLTAIGPTTTGARCCSLAQTTRETYAKGSDHCTTAVLPLKSRPNHTMP